MRSKLSEIVFRIGAKLRNPSLFSIYHELKSSEFKSREELERIQLDKLDELINFAKKYSDFYQDIYNKKEYHVEDIKSFEQLEKLPLIKKSDLIEKNAEIHTKYNFKKIRKADTSGTSGQSLSFYRDENWDSTNRAAVMRAYDMYDVKPWDKNAYFWGYNLSKSKAIIVSILDKLQNRKRLFSYSRENLISYSKDIKDAKFLSGYSSMIYQVAKIANKENITFPKVKMVKGTSEMILPAYQGEVLKAFGTKMISEYGAAETGLIAFECPKGNMHVNEENVIVETINGEIVVTNLVSYSFPVIRYVLGDVVKISDEKCSCGRNSKIISEIYGRKGKSVVGNNSEYPSLIFYYIFKNISKESNILLNYKAIQKEPGVVNIFIEGNREESVIKLIEKQRLSYFGTDVDFDYHFEDFFSAKKKKSQSFVSELKNG